MAYNPADPFAPLETSLTRTPVTLSATGELTDPVTLTREELERQAPEIARRLCECALGQRTMTYQEIQASKLVMDKLVASAVQRVDIRQTVEIRDKRAAIDAMVESILRPGAVQRRPDGSVALNLPATVTEARLARPDGRGPPAVDGSGAIVLDAAATDDTQTSTASP
jgi:hypothetical protein